jgi:hypothetical protein
MKDKTLKPQNLQARKHLVSLQNPKTRWKGWQHRKPCNTSRTFFGTTTSQAWTPSLPFWSSLVSPKRLLNLSRKWWSRSKCLKTLLKLRWQRSNARVWCATSLRLSSRRRRYLTPTQECTRATTSHQPSLRNQLLEKVGRARWRDSRPRRRDQEAVVTIQHLWPNNSFSLKIM